MKALLLAGGLGTRLRPLTENLPKPMAPVGNRPWLEHLILHFKDEGIEEFVIAVKHYPELIRNYFGDGKSLGVRIEYAVEDRLLGTAGAIKNAEPLLDDRFIAINADIINQISVLPLLEYHVQNKAQVTIGLTEVDDPSHYGVVEQDPEGRITRFVEKPKREEAPSNRINAGIYVMEKSVLDWIPEGKEVSIEKETFPALLQNGCAVYGKTVSGYWMDMGTKQRYRQVHWDLLDRKLRVPLKGNARKRGIWMGEGVSVGKGTLIVPPVLIGDGVKIGQRGVIGPYAVIGNECEIGNHARISETIMWDGCKVHHHAQLNHCIFGYDLEVGPKHILHEAVMYRIAEKRAEVLPG